MSFNLSSGLLWSFIKSRGHYSVHVLKSKVEISHASPFCYFRSLHFVSTPTQSRRRNNVQSQLNLQRGKTSSSITYRATSHVTSKFIARFEVGDTLNESSELHDLGS